MGLLRFPTLSIQFVLLFSLFLSMLSNCLPSVHPTHECLEDESYALLNFKESFAIRNFASMNPSSYPKTASWMRTKDCCSWDGIGCDEVTGHVIGIDLSSSQLYGSMDANSSLFSLVHLQSLDLSDNHFNHSQIPAKIGEFSQLKYLNLSQISESTFSGSIPSEVSRLSNLLSLDLRSYIDSFPDGPYNQLQLSTSTLRSLIQNSTKLQELHLDFVKISSFVPNILTNLTYLQKLSLFYCGLHDEFPVGIFHLPNLRILDLGGNQNLSGMLPDFHSSSLLSLLNLQGTSFYGTLPASIGNLNSLGWLSILQCNFNGSIPYSLRNLSQLVHLDLGYNRLSDEIPSWIMNLTNLGYLNLLENNFHGEIPRSLFSLVNLKTLFLGNNLLQGQIEFDMLLKLKVLTFLDLSYNNLSLFTRKSSSNVTLPPIQKLDLDSCNLSGEIPSWIMNLTTLSYLSLQKNNLQGEIPHSLFRLDNLASLSLQDNLLEGRLQLKPFLNLKNLSFLGFSRNNLSLLIENVSSNATLSPIEVLDLVSCNVVEFPTFFQDLDGLAYLDMSYNQLKSIPNWMWKKRSLQSLSVSHNSLTGEISPLICNLKSLVYLDLSFNNLSNMIPSCLGSFSQSLQALVLQGNKLIGHIPQTYMIGSALKMVDFSENNLEGQLPRALVNCRMLEFLDVSHNQINGQFPFWLGTLPELKVIGLRHNEFEGAIMCPKGCSFPKLHILDLSHNKFSGNLPPKIIKNWKSMTMSNMSQLGYEDNTIHFMGKSWFSHTRYAFTMSNKGIVMDYVDLQHLYYMVAIDLSGNKISGEIPDVIGDLKSLVLLNLSNNMLIGNIPSSLKKLSNLEALDLSLNNLSGTIPQQLTKLTFLEFFNVSFNNLSGPIPENKQFSTFQESSFKGNQDLCGIQLFKKCEDDVRPPPLVSNGDQDSNSGSFFEFDRKVVLIGYGGGLLVGLALGSAFSLDFVRWLKRIF